MMDVSLRLRSILFGAVAAHFFVPTIVFNIASFWLRDVIAWDVGRQVYAHTVLFSFGFLGPIAAVLGGAFSYRKRYDRIWQNIIILLFLVGVGMEVVNHLF